MADKDSGEHEIIKSNASVLICLFHILKSFRREVSYERWGLLEGKLNVTLHCY